MEHADVYRIAQVKGKTDDLRKYVLVKNLSDNVLYEFPITFLSCIGFGGKNLNRYLELYLKDGYTTLENVKRDSVKLSQIVK